MFNLIVKTLKIKDEKAMSKKSKKIIGFRVSEQEKKLLEQLAAAENKELSDYIRERIFSSAVKYELKCDSEREIRDIKQTINDKTEELKELLTKQLQEELNTVKSEIEKTQMRVKIAEKLIHQKCDVDLLKLFVLLTLQAIAVVLFIKL